MLHQWGSRGQLRERGGSRGKGRGRGGRKDFNPRYPISARSMEEALIMDDDLTQLVTSPGFKKLLLSESMSGENDIKVQVKHLFTIMQKLFELRPDASADNALLAISSSKLFIYAIPFHMIGGDASISSTFTNYRKDILSVCQQLIESFHITCKSKIESVGKILAGLQFIFPNDTDLESEVKRLKALPKQLEKENNERKNDLGHIQNLPIYPSVKELTGKSKDTHIEPFIVNGVYESIDKYAKILFELTREDIMRPLRDGICKYLENEAIKLTPSYLNAKGRREKRKLLQRVTEVHVYEAEPRGVITSRNGQNYKLNFKSDRKINWERAKNFMHGSLLVLSCDMFQTDRNLVVGVIAGSRQLTKGMIEIKIMSGSLQSGTKYVMVESSAFFLPIKNVLERIQSDDFIRIPFQNHIVTGVENRLVSEPTTPEYLSDGDTIYDLTALFPDDYEESVMTPVRDRIWNSEAHMIVQGEQLQAVKSALTDCISVIQGPPGTGKTFTAKLIMRILLDNSDVWLGDIRESPILLICYTNHALDQFLEGILDFEDSIVRFGGRSKSEKVAPYSINEARQTFRSSTGVHKLFWHAKETLNDIQERKNELELKFDRTYSDVISITDLYVADLIDEEIMNEIIDSVHLQDFGGETESSMLFDLLTSTASNHVKEWLALGFVGYRKVYASEIVKMATFTEKEEFDDTNKDDLERMSQEHINHEERRKIEDREHEECIVDEIIEDIEEITNFKYSEVSGVFKGLGVSEIEDGCRKWVRCLRRNEKTAIDQAITANQKSQEIPTSQLWLNAKSGNQADCLLFYGRLVTLYQDNLANEIELLDAEYSEAERAYKSVQLIQDTELCRTFKIVAMTTTLATQHFRLLRNIRCKIVMAEESAEVPESHLVACLTEFTQQLILIGDHQQLRPKVNCYELERDYNLGISLFERLIKNDFNFVRLGVQYRMQPNISTFMQQCFYEGLDNSPTVFQRPSDVVPVLGTCVQFINYGTLLNPERFYEEQEQDETSKSNTTEAEFAVLIAEFLVSTGYDPKKVTILTFYIGQFYKLREKVRKLSAEKRVDVQTVDNFQGQENNIIILSTVRSNGQNKGGFATIDNRACVALSRAKSALIVIGNITMLASTKNIWKDIEDHATANGNIDSGVWLRCPRHQDYLVKIEYDLAPISSTVFKSHFPLFGCTALCNTELDCGHICPKTCHSFEQHEIYKCLVVVNKHLKCSHTAQIQCHLDPEIYECLEQCDRMVSCGHACNQLCYVKCDPKNCHVPLTNLCSVCNTERIGPCKNREQLYLPCPERCCYEQKPCGHPCPSVCHSLSEHRAEPCLISCTEALPCGHECPLKCHEHIGNIHDTFNCQKECSRNCKSCGGKSCKSLCFEACDICKLEVRKTLPCGHWQKTLCNVPSEEVDCQTKCKRNLECGHSCNLKCFQDCSTAICMVTVSKMLPCEHEKKVHCSADLYIEKCSRKCRKPLDHCGHLCNQACFEECDAAKCTVPVSVTLSCGHEVALPCNGDVYNIKCMVSVTHVNNCGHESSFICHQRADSHDCQLLVEKSLPCGHYQLDYCCVNETTINCNTKVTKELACGHVRREVKCSEDIQELSKMCKSTCNKRLQCDHQCKLKCNEPCNSSACRVVVPKKCQSCDGQIHVECSSGKIKKLCPSQCQVRLACGHQCPSFCHSDLNFTHDSIRCRKPCDRACKTCGLKSCTLKCFEDCRRLKCSTKNVTKPMPCGHQMTGYCSQPPILCKEKCLKHLRCGHPCTMLCSESCTPTCTQPCRRIVNCRQPLSNPHVCQKKCHEPCQSRHNCEGLKHFDCPKCALKHSLGLHKCSVRDKCLKLCEATLSCGHNCSGDCTKCQGGLLHVNCEVKCGRRLVCGHICQGGCHDVCPPCTSKCTKRCAHSVCDHLCFSKCPPCLEPCKGLNCKRYCSSDCSHPKTTSRCKAVRKCGHRCEVIGHPGNLDFLHEKDHCAKCHKGIDERFYDILMMNESYDEEEVYIYLPDCGHRIEVDGLDAHVKSIMNDKTGEFKPIGCPKCSTQMMASDRYGKEFNRWNIRYEAIKHAYREDDIKSSRTLRKPIFELTLKLKLGGPFKIFKCANPSLKNAARLGSSNYETTKTKNFLLGLNYLQKSSKILLDLEQGLMSSVSKATESTDLLKVIQDYLETLHLIYVDLVSNPPVELPAEAADQLEDILLKITLMASWMSEAKKRELGGRCIEELAKLAKNIIYKPLKPRLAEIEKQTKSIIGQYTAVTTEEVESVVEALKKAEHGMRQGHWFECPSGHPYFIGECGGAVVKAICPCGARIGGAQHVLDSTNRVSIGITGSNFSAWEGEAQQNPAPDGDFNFN